jgi:uncharacterized membrane protein YeaQ/YmgE (transglycosylase-associated protein family)
VSGIPAQWFFNTNFTPRKEETTMSNEFGSNETPRESNAGQIPDFGIPAPDSASPFGQQTYCQQCGTLLNPGQIVCMRCGVPINAAGAYRPVHPAGVSDNSIALLVFSILMTCCCCIPGGVVGIVFSALSRSDFAAGRYESAASNARFAFWTLIIAFVGSVILVVLWCGLCAGVSFLED